MSGARSVLLTGGTGFVGANLARRLLCDGHQVHLLVRPDHSAWRIAEIREDVSLHVADLLDLDSLSKVVHHVHPDWVFHLAAYGAYSHQQDLNRIIKTNVLGTANLVAACLSHGFEAFVNAGSSSEYGYKDHAPLETERIDPNSDYAVTKSSATLFCHSTAQRHGAHIPTLRLYSVYGPYEQPTRLIPTLLVRGLEKRLPPLVEPGTARDYVFVEDVGEAFVRAAMTPGQEVGAVYNIGTGVQTRMAELVELARRELAIQEEPRWGSMPDRPWDTTTWVADNRKACDALGWRVHHPLREGLLETLRWLQEDPRNLDFYRTSIGAG